MNTCAPFLRSRTFTSENTCPVLRAQRLVRHHLLFVILESFLRWQAQLPVHGVHRWLASRTSVRGARPRCSSRQRALGLSPDWPSLPTPSERRAARLPSAHPARSGPLADGALRSPLTLRARRSRCSDFRFPKIGSRENHRLDDRSCSGLGLSLGPELSSQRRPESRVMRVVHHAVDRAVACERDIDR